MRKIRGMLKSLEEGRFEKLFADAEPLVQWVVRQASIPHTKSFALQIPQPNGWDLWAQFAILNTNPLEIAMYQIFIPGNPDALHAKPFELEGVPTYTTAPLA